MQTLLTFVASCFIALLIGASVYSFVLIAVAGYLGKILVRKLPEKNISYQALALLFLALMSILALSAGLPFRSNPEHRWIS